MPFQVWWFLLPNAVNMQDQLLDTWSREQRTVVFINHDVDETVNLANRLSSWPRCRERGPDWFG